MRNLFLEQSRKMPKKESSQKKQGKLPDTQKNGLIFFILLSIGELLESIGHHLYWFSIYSIPRKAEYAGQGQNKEQSQSQILKNRYPAGCLQGICYFMRSAIV